MNLRVYICLNTYSCFHVELLLSGVDAFSTYICIHTSMHVYICNHTYSCFRVELLLSGVDAFFVCI